MVSLVRVHAEDEELSYGIAKGMDGASGRKSDGRRGASKRSTGRRSKNVKRVGLTSTER